MLETMQRERACCQFGFEIVRHVYLSVLSGCDVQCFDHPTSGSIGISAVLHLLPQIAPVGIGQ
jgi:hypothetical protein